MLSLRRRRLPSQGFVRRHLKGLAVLAAATATASVAVGAAALAPARAATPWPGGRWQPDAATYGMTVVSRVPVTMDDGVVLPANIGYPTDRKTGKRAPGSFPVVLQQNPYTAFNQPNSYFVNRGYIFVTVDVRGTGDSTAPGDAPLINPMFGPRSARDGAEVVDWAAHHLDGSNGTIGLYGCSFLGIDQLFTAAALGPDSPVKAILPACASTNYETYFAGGIPAPTVGLFDTNPGPLSGNKHAKENQAAGKAEKAEIQAGGPRAYNGTFWQERTTSADMAAAIVHNGIPALLWSGYKAPDGMGSLEFFAALQNTWAGRPPGAPMAPGQSTTGRYQAVIGPWGHGTGLDRSIELEWYDTWLRGQDTGMTATSTPLHLYENGSGRWVNTASYPLTDTYSPYYLGADGALTPTPPAASAAGADALTWAAPDQAGATLTYTTKPFDRATTLAGPIAARLYAQSDNTNLELITTLQDVGTDGTATTITNGTVLGSLSDVDEQASWRDRNGQLTRPVHPFTADRYQPAGQTRPYDIRLYPNVWQLAPGHALRLVVSTQASKADCQGLLAPAQPCGYTDPQKASLPGGHYRIERGAASASQVTLPLISSDTLPTAASAKTPTSNGQLEPIGW